jgi:hypothetical protein
MSNFEMFVLSLLREGGLSSIKMFLRWIVNRNSGIILLSEELNGDGCFQVMAFASARGDQLPALRGPRRIMIVLSHLDKYYLYW